MDGGAWQATVHSVTESDRTEQLHFTSLRTALRASQEALLLKASTCQCMRRERWVPSLGWEDHLEEGIKPTPVFLPGGSHGQRTLVAYSPQGWAESDTTEATQHACCENSYTAVKTLYMLCRNWICWVKTYMERASVIQKEHKVCGHQLYILIFDLLSYFHLHRV